MVFCCFSETFSDCATACRRTLKSFTTRSNRLLSSTCRSCTRWCCCVASHAVLLCALTLRRPQELQAVESNRLQRYTALWQSFAMGSNYLNGFFRVLVSINRTRHALRFVRLCVVLIALRVQKQKKQKQKTTTTTKQQNNKTTKQQNNNRIHAVTNQLRQIAPRACLHCLPRCQRTSCQSIWYDEASFLTGFVCYKRLVF